MTLYTNPHSRRISWSGILAGLVMGLVTTMAILALGAIITALTGITLSGTGIQALIWVAIAALVGAYVAGMIATRASAPATLDDAAAMTKSDAGLTGTITGGMMVLGFSWLLASGLGSLVGLAGNVVGHAAGAVASTAGAALTTGAAGVAGASQLGPVQDYISNITPEDVETIIADNTNLSQEQLDATARVVSSVFRRASFDPSNVNITDLAQVTTNRVNYIKKELSGDQFVNRLERAGLSQAQAEDVRNQVTGQIDQWQKSATDAAAQAADTAQNTARQAGTYAGLSWLIPSALILLASHFGATNTAGGMRPVNRVNSQVAVDRDPRNPDNRR